MYVIQIKNKNHDECQCECTEFDDQGSCKDDYIGNPSPSNCQCNKACEDDILNATKTAPADKKSYMKKNCLIHTISLVIIIGMFNIKNLDPNKIKIDEKMFSFTTLDM